MATLDLRVCSTKGYSAHCRPSKFTGILELPLPFADGLRVLRNLASTPGISFSLTQAMCPLMAHMLVLAKPTCTCSSWSLASCFPNCACATASPEMWGQGQSPQWVSVQGHQQTPVSLPPGASRSPRGQGPPPQSVSIFP